jgi:hypothetical protein
MLTPSTIEADDLADRWEPIDASRPLAPAGA